MVEINLFDSNFTGQACSVATQTPRLMRYVRGQMDWPGVTVFTDGQMFSPIADDVQSRYKIGWLHEARALHPENYNGDRLMRIAHKFDAIMTHDATFRSFGAIVSAADPWTVKETPFLKTIRGGSWVPLDQWGMYPKTKNVAMILSEKTQLEGHQLRHAIAAAGLPIDLFGPQYTPIGHDKALAYRDYRYAVVVEACKEENFFSEHLIDALAFGCVPLYWGCPNIQMYFDPQSGNEHMSRGVWPFTNIAELVDRLGYAIPLIYHDEINLERVRTNQQAARAYAITEDWQVEHCLAPYLVQP